MAPIAKVLMARTARKAVDTGGSLLAAGDRSDLIAYNDGPYITLPTTKAPPNKWHGSGSSNSSIGRMSYRMANSASWDSSTEEDRSMSLHDDFSDLFGCPADNLPMFPPQTIQACKPSNKSNFQLVQSPKSKLEDNESYSAFRVPSHANGSAEKDLNDIQPNRRYVSDIQPGREERKAILKSAIKANINLMALRDEAPCDDNVTIATRKTLPMSTAPIVKDNRDDLATPLRQTRVGESNEKSFEIIPKKDYSRPTPTAATTTKTSNSQRLRSRSLGRLERRTSKGDQNLEVGKTERQGASNAVLKTATKTADRLNHRTPSSFNSRNDQKPQELVAPAKPETMSSETRKRQKLMPATRERKIFDGHRGSIAQVISIQGGDPVVVARAASLLKVHPRDVYSYKQSQAESKRLELATTSNDVLNTSMTTLAARLKNRASTITSGRRVPNNRESSLSRAEKDEIKPIDTEAWTVSAERPVADFQNVNSTKSQIVQSSTLSDEQQQAAANLENSLSTSILSTPSTRQSRSRRLRGKGGRDKIPDFLEIPGCTKSLSFGSTTENSSETEHNDVSFTNDEREPVRTNEVIEIVVAPLPSRGRIAVSRNSFPQLSLLDRDEDKSMISTRSIISFRSLGKSFRRVRSLRLRGKDDNSEATLSVATSGSLFRRKMWNRRENASRSGLSVTTTGTAKNKRKWFRFTRRRSATNPEPPQHILSNDMESVSVESTPSEPDVSAEEPTLVEEFFEAITRCSTNYQCAGLSAIGEHAVGGRTPEIESSRKVTFKKRSLTSNRRRRPYDSDSDDTDDGDATACFNGRL